MAFSMEKRKCYECNQFQKRDKYSNTQWRKTRRRSCNVCKKPSKHGNNQRNGNGTDTEELTMDIFPRKRVKKRKRRNIESPSCERISNREYGRDLEAVKCFFQSAPAKSHSSFTGVTNSPPHFMDKASAFKFRTSLDADDLVGRYNVVYFVSAPSMEFSRHGIGKKEDFITTLSHRTVKGSAEIKIQDEGFMIGNIILQDDSIMLNDLPSCGNRFLFADDSILKGRPLHRTMNSPNPNIQSDDWTHPDGMLHLVVVTGDSDRMCHLDFDNPTWTYNRPYECRVKVLTNRVPIGVYHQRHLDNCHESFVSSQVVVPIISLKDSIARMKDYHTGNGTKSWLCHFFNIPEDVVALIRAYTTPPPVF